MSRSVLLLDMAAGATQRVESVAMRAYLTDACALIFPTDTVKINSLLEDTPYHLVVEYMLSGRRIRPHLDPRELGLEYVILTISVVSVLLSYLRECDFVVADMNGAPPSPGTAAFVGLISEVPRPIVYWKDDSRWMWGAADNPLVTGLCPSVSKLLVVQGSPGISLGGGLNRWTSYDPSFPDNCGAPTYPLNIGLSYQNKFNLLAVPAPGAYPAAPAFNYTSTYNQDLADIGVLLRGLVPGGQTFASYARTFPTTLFDEILAVMDANKLKLSAADRTYLFP